METTFGRNFFEIPLNALIASVLIHLFLPLAFVLLGMVEGWDLPFLQRRNTQAKLYQNYIQVDVIDLPNLKQAEQQFIDAAKPIVENPSVKKEIEVAVPDPEIMAQKLREEKKQEKAQALKKQAEDREKALKALKGEAARDDALKALEGRVEMKGNILSKGTSATGALGSEAQQYWALVQSAVKSQFNFYPWQTNRGLSTTVSFRILPDGTVAGNDVKIVQSSLDPTFDSAVKKAILEAKLPLPQDLSLLQQDVNIIFKPEE